MHGVASASIEWYRRCSGLLRSSILDRYKIARRDVRPLEMKSGTPGAPRNGTKALGEFRGRAGKCFTAACENAEPAHT